MDKKYIFCLLIALLLLCGCATSKGTAALTDSAQSSASQAFKVTGVDVGTNSANIATWFCGSFIQVVYNATFHITPGPYGGTIHFAYTLNNGRSQTVEQLSIIPGQTMSSYLFTWQGALPADHTYPGAGGVQVNSPNMIASKTIAPIGKCR